MLPGNWQRAILPVAAVAVDASRKREPPNGFDELDFRFTLAGSIATVATNKMEAWELR
jgi:hypothetical protein